MNRRKNARSSGALCALLALLGAALSLSSAVAAAKGEPCGGLRGAQCAQGEFCDYPERAQCGAADQTGVCTPKPQACTFEYAPVCGCDDQTYPNACAARAAGVSVASRGECPGSSSCESDEDCPHGECVGGTTCAGLQCPPPPKPSCSVCGDGSRLVCKSLPQPCPDGQVREIVDGCYGECVDRQSCDPPRRTSCQYAGRTYQVGENFPATDGCNRCSCDASGRAMCTLKLCPPKQCDYDNPYRSWVAKDPESCKVVRFSCAPNSRYFSNECGCGCERTPQPVPPPRPSPTCRVGGCSSQLCYDAASGGGVSTCEWREEYACYRNARCGVQPDGRCGWSMTPELRACLSGSR